MRTLWRLILLSAFNFGTAIPGLRRKRALKDSGVLAIFCCLSRFSTDIVLDSRQFSFSNTIRLRTRGT